MIFKAWSILPREAVLGLFTSALAITILIILRRYKRFTKHRTSNMNAPQPIGDTADLDETTFEPGPRLRSATPRNNKCISCGVSFIGGKQKQEDAWSAADVNGNRILAIADGISSSNQARLASQSAVDTAIRGAKEIWDREAEVEISDLKEIFYQAQRAVEEQAEGLPKDGVFPATTLVIAIDQPGRFLLGYLGDGAMVLTTGSLKWMQNLLFPQTGRSGEITSFLGADCKGAMPVVMELPKTWPDGGILLLGSDGALPLGEVLSTSLQILDEIRASYDNTQPGIEITYEVLSQWVQKRLNSDDNRTLCVLVSSEALSYWDEMNSVLDYRLVGQK